MAEDYKTLDKEYIVNVYNRVGAVLDHGKGAVLYDVCLLYTSPSPRDS